MQLIESRPGETNIGTRLGPGKTGWAGLHHGHSVGDDAMLSDSRCNAGIFEDAVENLGRSSTNFIGHARNGRGSRSRRLAGDKSAAEKQHEQKTGSDRLILILATRHNSKGLLLGLLSRGLLIEVVDKDVVVPFAIAHVEVVHVRGEVGEGRARGHGGRVIAGTLKPLGKNRDLLAKFTGLESVSADELFFVEMELVDKLVHLHLLTVPVLLLRQNTVVLDPQVGEVFLEAADLVSPGLLLFLELLSMLLLSLP